MDTTTAGILVATHIVCVAVGFGLGSVRSRARTTLERDALEALRLGDHPPLYKYEETPTKDEKPKL